MSLCPSGDSCVKRRAVRIGLTPPKLGVIAGSLLSGALGYAVLRFASPAVNAVEAETEIDREIAQDGDIAAIEEKERS